MLIVPSVPEPPGVVLMYQVTAVFHGHSHHGKAEGKTKSGIPVYNVSLPVLRQAGADQPLFRVLELNVAQAPAPELAKT